MHQKRKRLDQPAGDSLSLIDLALADLAENMNEKREGEFKTSDIVAAKGMHPHAARHECEKMVRDGKWTRRNAGKFVFYRRA